MAAEIDLSALMSSLSRWEIAGYVGLAIVIAGVIGEGIHDFTGWWRQTWWGPRGGRLSILVLIAGLAVEGIAQVNANNDSGQIIAFLGDQEATTRERAAKLEKELETLRSARRLTREAQARIANNLRRFAGTPFDLSSNQDIEPINLALDIRAEGSSRWLRPPQW